MLKYDVSSYVYLSSLDPRLLIIFNVVVKCIINFIIIYTEKNCKLFKLNTVEPLYSRHSCRVYFRISLKRGKHIVANFKRGQIRILRGERGATPY